MLRLESYVHTPSERTLRAVEIRASRTKSSRNIEQRFVEHSRLQYEARKSMEISNLAIMQPISVRRVRRVCDCMRDRDSRREGVFVSYICCGTCGEAYEMRKSWRIPECGSSSLDEHSILYYGPGPILPIGGVEDGKDN